MKRVWYLSFVMLTLVFSACAEDDAAEQPSFLTLEERNIQSNSASFYLRANENAGDGMAYFGIAEASDPAPTASSLKNDSATSSTAISGGEFKIASFLSLTPGTSYVIYAFMEIDGSESQLATLAITTP